MQMDIESIQEADEEHEIERIENRNSNIDFSDNRMETEYVDDDEQAYDLNSIEEVFGKYIWIVSAWLVSLLFSYLTLIDFIDIDSVLVPLLLLELKFSFTNLSLLRDEFQVLDHIWKSIHFMRLLDCIAHILSYSLILLHLHHLSVLFAFSAVPLGFMQILRMFIKINSPNKCVTFAGIVHNIQRWGKLVIFINLSIRLDNFLIISWSVVFWPGLAWICLGFLITLPLLCVFSQNLLSRHRDMNLVYIHCWLLFLTFGSSMTFLVFYLYFSLSRSKFLVLPFVYLLCFVILTARLRRELTLASWEFFVADNFSESQFSNYDQPLPIPGSQKLYIDRSLKNKLTKVIKQAPAALVKLAKPNIQSRSDKLKRRNLSRRTLSQVMEYPNSKNSHVRSQSSNLAYDFSSIKPLCKFCTINDGVNRFTECGHGELCAGCADQYLQSKTKCYVCQGTVTSVLNEYNERRKHSKKFSFGEIMTTSIRIKSKLSPTSRTGTEILHFGKKNLMNTCRSDQLITFNEKKLLKTLQDSKVIHNVNLQIPSLNSPNLSTSTSKNRKRQTASIKGFSSKISVRPSKEGLKSKKSTKEFLIREGLSEMAPEVEMSGVDKNMKKNIGIENELKKAIEENKRLKKIMDEEKGFESEIDDLMKSFKSRLFKLLYD